MRVWFDCILLSPFIQVAVKLLKTVAERGEWASILREAYTDYMNGFDRKSLLLYLQAAEEGFEVAQSNAAWLLERERAADVFASARERRALAMRYWLRAAEQGSAEAQVCSAPCSSWPWSSPYSLSLSSSLCACVVF